MADPDSPEGAVIAEALGVVSIEVDVLDDDQPVRDNAIVQLLAQNQNTVLSWLI